MILPRRFFLYLAVIGGLLLIVGFQARLRSKLRHDVAAMQQDVASLDAQVAAVRRLRDEARADDALLKNTLQPAAADLTTPKPAAWSTRVQRLHHILAARPDLQIPELKLLREKDWLQVAHTAEFDTEDHVRDAAAALRELAKDYFARALQPALKKFTAASEGELPSDVQQLASLCAPPVDADMLSRYTMLRTGKAGSISEDLIAEKSPLDLTRDGKLAISLSGQSTEIETMAPPSGNAAAVTPDVAADFRQAALAFAAAHHGTEPTTPEELRPYLKDPAKLDAMLSEARRTANPSLGK